MTQLNLLDMFYISQKVNSKRYFLVDVDVRKGNVLWTKHHNKGLAFGTPDEAQQVIDRFLPTRKNIEIIER